MPTMGLIPKQLRYKDFLILLKIQSDLPGKKSRSNQMQISLQTRQIKKIAIAKKITQRDIFIPTRIIGLKINTLDGAPIFQIMALLISLR
ncbi:hypothetical protein [Teredinibacter sp. KSP-S5-2]|uniref:hypothetical protein n=1 Tax=Teredinibacter sp. KSP-S5-2 TaxID=3034506 RepID=UPI002934D074|nr:hypothetical protein [Teredinibacter sp. KSP-S5-2]WNO11641.1 hypothetical protein P5V12_10705 [Teredinibacter sp. KSP-S5-2]